MRNGILASVLLVVCCSIGVLFAEEQMAPRIEIKEMQHNFGKVVQGMLVDHVFEIRNAGNAMLVIERVVPS